MRMSGSRRLVVLMTIVVCFHLGTWAVGAKAEAGKLKVRNVTASKTVGKPLTVDRKDDASNHRVLISSVIRAPEFKDLQCANGLKRDPMGNCRSVW